MKVGLLLEGTKDISALKIIVERILTEELRTPPIKYNVYSAHGPIVGKMAAATERFFDADDSCDFAIFCTDKDHSVSKTKKVEPFINAYNNRGLGQIAFANPNPHFEKWLITDQDTVKRLFGFDGRRPLPHPLCDPKEALDQYLSDSGFGFEILVGDIMESLAKNMDLQICKTDTAFNSFFQSIQQICNHAS